MGERKLADPAARVALDDEVRGGFPQHGADGPMAARADADDRSLFGQSRHLEEESPVDRPPSRDEKPCGLGERDLHDHGLVRRLSSK